MERQELLNFSFALTMFINNHYPDIVRSRRKLTAVAVSIRIKVIQELTYGRENTLELWIENVVNNLILRNRWVNKEDLETAFRRHVYEIMKNKVQYTKDSNKVLM